MKVKAKVGIKVPMENRANQFIEQQPVEVAESLYYRRLVQEGDLIVVKSTKHSVTRSSEKGEE